MVAQDLSSYMKEKDKNGHEVALWAEKKVQGIARCKFCDCCVDFKSGKRALTRHSESEKHKAKVPKQSGKVKQMTIQEALSGITEEAKMEKEVTDKAKDLEIDLARRFVRHNIPLESIDCVVNCLKKHITDSDIVNKIKLSDSKARYIVNQGVGAEYEVETIKLLQDCDAFSAGIDESEVNKVTECEVLVKISNKDGGIQLRHYRTLDLAATDAETIVNTLLEQFEDDGVDYKRKLISVMTDGCSVMEGKHSGVKKRLSEKISQLKDFGSCNDHHLGNAMEKGTEAFDEDVAMAAMNIYFDLGGAKGKGLKRKKEFEKVAEDKGIEVKAFKKLCSTRFRGIRLSLDPILHNWSAIISYYTSVKKPTDRQVVFGFKMILSVGINTHIVGRRLF